MPIHTCLDEQPLLLQSIDDSEVSHLRRQFIPASMDSLSYYSPLTTAKYRIFDANTLLVRIAYYPTLYQEISNIRFSWGENARKSSIMHCGLIDLHRPTAFYILVSKRRHLINPRWAQRNLGTKNMSYTLRGAPLSCPEAQNTTTAEVRPYSQCKKNSWSGHRYTKDPQNTFRNFT